MSEHEDLMGALKEEVTRRLNAARPARYDNKDREWMEEVEAYALVHYPGKPEMIVRDTVHAFVRQLESNANRKANGTIRKYINQPTLFGWDDLWAQIGPLPLTLDDRTGLRVRFDAATPEDMERHAWDRHRKAQENAKAETAVATVQRWWATCARRAGLDRVAMIPDPGLPLRSDGRIADLEWDDEWPEDDASVG